MQRSTIRIMCLIVAALLLPFPTGASEETCNNTSNQRALTIGPMLQNLSSSGVTVVWATDTSVIGYVNFSKDLSFSGSVADVSPCTFHELNITGLDANATYNYYVDGAGRSPNCTFKTAPTEGPEHFRFAVYGDTRTNNVAHASVFNRMVSYGPEFILNVGDLVTSGGSVTDWTGFLDVIRPGVNSTCYWPSIGNHDYPLPYYLQNFSLPGNERWYSFDYGSAHIVALEVTTTVNYANGSPQNDWLRADLAAHNGTEWTFVFFHNPLYSSGGHGSDTNARAVLDPIFEQYGVDVVFTGHDHMYEHAYPGNGIHYFVTGGGGAPLAAVGSNSWTVYSETTYECMILDVDDNITRILTVRPDNSTVERINISHPDRRAPAQVPVTAADTGIGGQVLVNWSGYNESAQGDVAQYRLFVSMANRTNVSGLVPNMTLQPGTFSALVNGLQNNTPHYFAVVAADEVPNLLLSANFACATPTDRTPPAPPAGLRTTAVGFTSIGLAWNASTEPDLAGYRLYMNDTGSNSSFHPISNVLSGTAHTVLNLTENTTYTFALDAIDRALPVPNNSTLSAKVTGKTPRMNHPPSDIAGEITLTIPEDSGPVFVAYDSVFSDPDGDALVFWVGYSNGVIVTMTANGTGIAIRPNKDWYGLVLVNLIANDTKTETMADIVVNVTPVNDPPLIADFSPKEELVINETDSIDFSITATDVDTPAIVLVYSWYLDGKAVPSVTSQYSYRTDYDSAGNHTIRVEVSDRELTTGREWPVTVKNRNRPPEAVMILFPGEGAVFVSGRAVAFNGTARDPDADTLSFTWYADGIDVGHGAAVEAGLPVGTHAISLAASDAEATVRSGTVNITIAPNTKPVVSISPEGSDFTVRTDRPVGINVTANDPEGDPISIRWSDGGKSLGNGSSFSTAGLPPGKHVIAVSVSDGFNEPVEKTFNLTIKEPPVPVARQDTAPFIIAGILIALAAGLVVALVLLRRKRRAGP